MADLPASVAAFAKEWPKFLVFLRERGSEILPATNLYEIARFTTDQGTGVVYRNGGDRISSWTGGADTAFRAWKDRVPWRARPKTKRPSHRNRQRRGDLRALTARDGLLCVYCGCDLTEETATIEHFVSVTDGGPDTLANKGLACEPCNTAAGSLSVVEKIRRCRK